MVRVATVAAVLLVVAAGCGGSGQSEVDRFRSIDEELSTLPDPEPGLGEAAPPAALTSGWRTAFRKRLVPLTEFQSGGPGKDGIQAIDRPRFAPAGEVDFLEPREPVIAVEVGGDVRAYPIQILIWHEIVNDTVGGVPVAVTFCPLCNTAIAFDRRLGSRTLDFGVTGNLRSGPTFASCAEPLGPQTLRFGEQRSGRWSGDAGWGRSTQPTTRETT